MRHRRTLLPGRGVGLGITLCLALGAPAAQASNGSKLRTPVVFQNQPCLSTIAKGQGSQAPLTIDFSVPREDTELTEDELPDSRTAQLFAVCADLPLDQDLPNWVDEDDATRSLEIGNIEALPDAEDVLATSSAWPLGSCVFPILDKDDRVPLSCAGTEDPASWDASQVPSGTYVVRGYTFEPAFNLWARRLGVVAVHDAGEPLPAAAALMSPTTSARVYADSGYEVAGCAVGPEGSTLQLQWAAVTAPEAWTTFHDGPAASSAEAADFTIEFSPPPEAENQAVWIRAVVTPPAGEPWIGYAVEPLLVVPGEGESDPPDVVEAFDICAVGDGGDTDGGDEGDTDTGGQADGSSGGGCRVADPRQGAPLALALVVLLSLRRRRSAI